MAAHNPIAPTPDQHIADSGGGNASITVQLFGDQPKGHIMGQFQEMALGERDHKQLEGAKKVPQPAHQNAKPKSSLLTRARNSTINLASLATVTNRFTCSASVGNLWHHGQHHANNQAQLPDHSSAVNGIQQLDYVTTSAFDSYQPDGATSPAKEPICMKSSSSSSSHKLLSAGGLSGRKLSTKEKCKRQKDVERLEKLRLLVSYLKSGSSQPMVSPVALEADEIELAERYKLHMILHDDLPPADGPPTNGDHRQPNQAHQSPSSSTGNTCNLVDVVGSGGVEQVKPCLLAGGEESALGGKQARGGRIMSHSICGTTTSSPASSSCNSMSHAHSTNDARSIPHIGTVTWVLRHSISDPGNNFEHSPSFSSASSSSHNHHHNHHHHHQLQLQLHLHHLHNHHNHHRHTLNQHQSAKHEISFGSAGDGASGPMAQSECAQCGSCAPSSSYSGMSLNNYCSAPIINKEAPGTSQGQPTSNQHKSPKLFYIDDLDHIPSGPTGMAAATAPFHTSGPLLLAPPSTPAVSTSTNNNTINQSQQQSPLSAALGSPASTATCCSQPTTPAISTTSSDCLRNSSSASTSAWSNAPNLATWIDNEVNSLVHDLEAESQQLSNKSGSKKSKKKWLSVTSSNSRRNSSGAQST